VLIRLSTNRVLFPAPASPPRHLRF
jgi:hypothetical protein